MAAHRSRWRAVLLGSTVLLCVAAPTATPDAAAAAPRAPLLAAVAGEFESADCPVEIPPEDARRVTCGVLTVPERRGPEGDPTRTIQLPVAVIASRSATPAADPLVFPTSGGPGGGSLSALGYWLHDADWADGERDIILMEQRGDAVAEPSLNCPELDTENFIVDGVLLSGAADSARRREQLEACHARLTADAIDLAAYTSAASAADLADLRKALGYDAWNLYGVSYGARLALTTMRDQPAGLRSVILDGAYPPNVNRYEREPEGFATALDALTAHCAADAACGELYPGLEQTLLEVLESAEESPLTVVGKHPVDRSPLEIRIDDTDLARDLFLALYDPSVVRVLPFVIDQLARGNVDAVLPLAQQTIDNGDWINDGLELSIECAEEIPFNDDAVIASAREADPILTHLPVDETLRSNCELWNVPPLSAVENAAVASAIPTLLTSGGYDPITPAAWSEAAAEQLALHRHYHFPTMGHGAVWANRVDPCPASIAEQFLRDPAAEPDASCIESMPPTDFLTTEDIQPTAAIYSLGSDVIIDRDPLQVAVAGTTILVSVATLLYALVYGLAWLGRRRGGAPAGTVLAAATAAGLYLAYGIGLALILLNTDPLILGFGLPSGVWPLLIVPFVAVAATILLIALLVHAWVRDEGSMAHRVALSVSAIASIGFAVWLVSRGLLLL